MINYMSDIIWDDVEAAMSTFVPTSGGYSIAKRGIVTLANGLRVFVNWQPTSKLPNLLTKRLSRTNG